MKYTICGFCFKIGDIGVKVHIFKNVIFGVRLIRLIMLIANENYLWHTHSPNYRADFSENWHRGRGDHELVLKSFWEKSSCKFQNGGHINFSENFIFFSFYHVALQT